MANVSKASTTWRGNLVNGSGTTTAVSSGRFTDLPVSWAARTEAHGGKTSPEELVAAVHASCFAMALSAGLARAGLTATQLDVTASVTFDKVGDAWTVVSSDIEVKGVVPGTDQAAFAAAAEGTKEGCPISRALKGNVKLGVKATLAF